MFPLSSSSMGITYKHLVMQFKVQNILVCIQFKHSFVQIRKGYFIDVERLFPSTKYSLNPLHFHKPKQILSRASTGIRIVLGPY